MGIITTLERRSISDLDDRWYMPVLPRTASKVEVDERTALGHAAVWNAVVILAGAMGALPLKLYRKEGATKEPARDHRLFDLFHRRPNGWQTAFEYREMVQGHILLRGNAYAQKVTDRAGRLLELVPLHPARMRVVVESDRLIYRFRKSDGRDRDFAPEEIHHLRGLSDGLVGYSPITVARESIGLGMAAQQHGARFFGNFARPGGVLSTDGKLEKEQRDRIKDSWDRSQGGDSRHSVAVLEGGLAWQSIGFSAQDSQFLETREFEVVEVARWFNLPPHKLKELTRSTHNNIESQNIEFVVDSIMPWAVRWEQRCDVDFLTEQERRDGFFFKFNLDALLRGDSAARAEFYTALFNMASLSPNEIREKEDMNPYEGGDQRFFPVNMFPIELADQMGLESTEPVPTPQRALPAGTETREGPNAETRSINLRRRYHDSYRGIFTSVGERIVSREVNAIGRAITAELGGRGVPNLMERLADFWEDHGRYVRGQMLPVLTSYMDVIGAAAAEEIDAEFEMDVRSSAFVESFAQAAAERHVGSSRGQIEGIIAGTDPDELEDALRERLKNWEETRAAAIGTRNAIQGGGAFARFVYDRNGRRTVWRTIGSTCPYCNRLDGRTVGHGQTFLNAGDEVDPESEDHTPLKVRTGISHPQLHRGCFPGDVLVSVAQQPVPSATAALGHADHPNGLCLAHATAAQAQVAVAGGVELLASTERRFNGDLVVLRTASGKDLRCTPNHPVLTPAGWVPAGVLDVGDHVIGSRLGDRDAAVIGDRENVPTRIEDVAKTLRHASEVVAVPVPGTAIDFHGDGRDGEVTIVRADRLLLDKLDAARPQHGGKGFLGIGDADAATLAGLGGAYERVAGVGATALRSMGRTRLGLPLGAGHALGARPAGGATPADLYALLQEDSTDRGPTYPQLLREGEFGPAGEVFADEVVGIEREAFHGPVFNLQTRTGLIIAEGVVTHNCDCVVAAV